MKTKYAGGEVMWDATERDEEPHDYSDGDEKVVCPCCGRIPERTVYYTTAVGATQHLISRSRNGRNGEVEALYRCERCHQEYKLVFTPGKKNDLYNKSMKRGWRKG